MKAKLIKCKRVIDGLGNVRENATILVDESGKIEDIRGGSEAAASAPDREQVDWTGYTVVPGFIDCHDHLAIDVGDEKAQAYETPARHVIRSVRNAEKMIRSGITTLRDVGEKGFIDVELREAIAQGELVGPRMLIAGQFITRTGGHGWYFGEEVDGPAEVLKAVRRQLRMGVDLIKIMGTGGFGTPGSVPTQPDFNEEEIRTAIEEAHAHGRRIAGHIHGGPAATWAIQHGIDSVEHGCCLTKDQLELMVEKGTYLVVTWGVGEYAAKGPGIPEFYRKKSLDNLEQYRRIISEAVELGVKIAVGGDTYHARTWEEMKALVDAGMSPMDAIGAATRNGADLCGILEETGTVETGKYADLVALRDNPLEDITRTADVAAVMKQGQLIQL